MSRIVLNRKGGVSWIVPFIILSLAPAVGAAGNDPTADSGFYPEEYRTLKNPLPFDRETIAIGRKIYTDQQCVSCHGIRGDGKGDAATVGRFTPSPRAFTDAAVMSKKSDGMLYYSISKGVHGTWMLPREKLLTEKDRWAVIQYIRSFAEPAAPPHQAKPEKQNVK